MAHSCLHLSGNHSDVIVVTILPVVSFCKQANSLRMEKLWLGTCKHVISLSSWHLLGNKMSKNSLMDSRHCQALSSGIYHLVLKQRRITKVAFEDLFLKITATSAQLM